MKKLFICVMTSLCSTFAFADADLVVNGVTIPSGGTKTMQVVINKANTTAFQFDMKLPAGISVSAFGAETETRKFENALYNANDNVWRFLSYDEGNAIFDAGTTFNITLAAATDVEGEAETSEILLVDPEGNGSGYEDGNVVVTVENEVSITVGTTGKSTLVYDKDLDFSTVENLKAYIATGYNKSKGTFMLTRVKDVPAGTPVMLIGPATNAATTYKVPVTVSQTYYPDNYLKGNATSDVDLDKSGSYINLALQSGTFRPIAETDATFPAGKCYLQLPAAIYSNVGNAWSFTMGSSGKKTYVGKNDLDFTSVNGLSAYTVTGYSKKGTFFMTRVKKVSAGTPLYLVGTANQPYDVPSVAVESSYISMLEGDAENSTVLYRISGEFTNFVLQSGQFYPLSVEVENAFPAGACYLPIPTSFLPSASRGEGNINSSVVEEVEVITMSLYGGIVGDGDTTGIRSIDEGQFTNDVWYNLNGQRIDTPTKKGLYIKNGKKVLVK